MLIAAIEGVTRIIGKSQGYLGLPLRDEVMNCAVTGEGPRPWCRHGSRRRTN